MTTTFERDWRSRAACRDIPDPDLFFPTAERGPRFEAQVAAAKAVCGRCVVQVQCLTFALDALVDGIAGGLTPDERRGLSRAGPTAGPAEDWPDRMAPDAQRAALGAQLLAQGRPVRVVAQCCGVSERTVQRWSARRPRAVSA